MTLLWPVGDFVGWTEERQEADWEGKKEEDHGREVQTPEHRQLQWGQPEVNTHIPAASHVLEVFHVISKSDISMSDEMFGSSGTRPRSCGSGCTTWRPWSTTTVSSSKGRDTRSVRGGDVCSTSSFYHIRRTFKNTWEEVPVSDFCLCLSGDLSQKPHRWAAETVSKRKQWGENISKLMADFYSAWLQSSKCVVLFLLYFLIYFPLVLVITFYYSLYESYLSCRSFFSIQLN